MIGFQLKRTLLLGIKSLWLHRLRSFLTMLGMVLGVGAVILMLAIGEGASYEAQEQMKQLGSTNIIIKSVKPPEDRKKADDRRSLPSYGLTFRDTEQIAGTLPSVRVTVPVRAIRKKVRRLARTTAAHLLGTVPWFPEIRNRTLARGRFFTSTDMYLNANVCVIEPEIADALFPTEDPLAKTIRVERNFYRVVGIMAPPPGGGGKSTGAGEGGADGNEGQRGGIYLPLTTTRMHYGDIFIERGSGSFLAEKVELHQITVRVESIEQVITTAKAVRAILERNHAKADYELIVPLERLEVAKKVKRTFNFVLGSIACVSLIVGGIGIMNIMLATVTERTREIGIRRALGAKKRHIVIQFLSETILLAATGGLLGLGLGVGAPPLIETILKKPTIVTLWSMVVAFSLSVSVGIVSGLYPACRAANMNPIDALRHE